uniref:Uncharacterized protein n=1 Tax=Physcomitrium patens TaxID=3218 RepID=A0A2K1KM97_PHYPA|nr:hypothetical protein PHYPA_005801 [Physcomitrium patens]
MLPFLFAALHHVEGGAGGRSDTSLHRPCYSRPFAGVASNSALSLHRIRAIRHESFTSSVRWGLFSCSI